MIMRTCDHCTYCCWSHGIPDCPVPTKSGHPSKETYYKPGAEPCPYIESWGCRIYHESRFPEACRVFFCKYLKGDPIHRPDKFESIIKEILTAKGTVFPMIPLHIPIDAAIDLIRSTKAMPESEKGNPLTMLCGSTQAEKDFAAEKWLEVLLG